MMMTINDTLKQTPLNSGKIFSMRLSYIINFEELLTIYPNAVESSLLIGKSTKGGIDFCQKARYHITYRM